MRQLSRRFSTNVFDRELKRRQRDLASRRITAPEFDYLRVEVAKRLADRLEDIQKEFPTALDVGCHAGHMYGAIADQAGLGGSGGVGGVRVLVQGDCSESCARRAKQVHNY